MTVDAALGERWLSRLAGVRSVPVLQAHGGGLAQAQRGYVAPTATAQLEAMTGGDPVGLQLVAVAAIRLALAAIDRGTRHTVLMPSPRTAGRRGELALCAPLDLSTPVTAFLGTLHEELESAAQLAWSDRVALIARLEAAGLQVAGALSQIGLSCEGAGSGRLGPVTVAVAVRRGRGGLTVDIEAPRGRLPSAATTLAQCVAATMSSIASDPHQRCRDVDLLGEAQRSRLARWSGLPCPNAFPAGTLTEIVDVAAARGPARQAVVDGAVSWAHRELRDASWRAGGLLAGRYGVRRGDRVALLLPRGPELILAILSVLRVGASFVPLDPAHPPARLARQLHLSQAVCVITNGDPPGGVVLPTIMGGELAAAPPGGRPPTGPAPDDEAVLFFTSGSTGLPRPLALTHRQVAYKVVSSGRLVGFDAETRCALLSAISSDALTYQVFTTLAAGGCVVPVGTPHEIDPAEFWERVAELGVNAINCVPSLLAVMAEGLPEGAERAVRHLILGGDEIPSGLLRRVARRLRAETFVNLYGPTEATIEATTYLAIGDRLPELSTVPIGRPSPGYGVVVLTERGDHAPAGVPGEIHILGPGVGAGYLDAEPTGPDRFHELPWLPGVRAFRTGDFGRWRLDGDLEFLGRRDRQIQVHGNRVELGEVEVALGGIPGIRSVAVVPIVDPPRPPGIVAVYTAEGHPPAGAVRAELAAQLPGYMVPERLLQLDVIPVTPHGKVDHQAILAIIDSADDEIWTPPDGFGRIVGEAWTDLLGRPPRAGDEDLFAAGGHSLTAAMLARRLCGRVNGNIVTVGQVFAARTPEALTGVLRCSARTADSPPGSTGVRPAIPSRLPASNAQHRMWFLEQYEEGELRPYNMVEAFRLRGPIDVPALTDALHHVVRRHHALRTVLRLDGDRLDQVVRAPDTATVDLDVRAAGPAEVDNALREIVATEQRRKVDLGSGPLLRAFWLAEVDGGGTLVLSVHHSVCDGWSIAVILQDLLRCLHPDAASALVDPVQYGEHSVALATRLRSPAGERSREFWHRTLAGLPRVELLLDRRRPVPRSSAAGTVRLSMGADVTRSLRALCSAARTTPFVGMVAAVRALLYRLCRAEDIPLGTIVSGRDDPRLADSVGLFANTVVLRTRVDPECGFRALVTAVASGAANARAHDEYPFELLVDELGTERIPGRNPLFDVLVESAFSGVSQLDPDAGAAVDHVPVEASVAPFDLAFSVTEPEPSGPIELRVSYRRDIFDDETVHRMAEQLRHVLHGLVAAPDMPIATVAYLPDEQRAVLLDTVNRTAIPFPSDRTLLDLIDDQVAKHPDGLAVVHDGRMLSFAELDRLAGNLASRIVSTTDPRPDQPVALACGRTEWMVVALVAVVKAGVPVLPLDPDQPVARLTRILRDSGAAAVLVDSTRLSEFADGDTPVLVVDDDAEAPDRWIRRSAEPTDLAYIVYTSGSTGTPKGAMIEHRGIVNTIFHRIRYFGFGPDACVLQVDPIHFDAGIVDVFTALSAATPLVVVGREHLLDPAQVADVVKHNRVTHVMMVPSLYQLMLDYAAPALRSIRQIVLGGERLSEALAARHAQLLPATELHNDYGPAEDSVTTTLCRVDGVTGDVPLGYPIANKTVDLLDERGELVPFGVQGEICIGGAGLARGYVGDDKLTAQRFTANPVRPGERMYRTGDLARRFSDGRLQFLGRIDDQVKIRGQLVEPGEVTAALVLAPGVRHAAVLAAPGPTGETRLVAYVVGGADPATLRVFLAQRLPKVMLPEVYVSLPELPLTANGKLDRRALPPIQGDAPVVTRERPFTMAEERVARLWSDVLQRQVTDPDANLFELGGHSLAAARIAYQLGVPVGVIFSSQTVRELARIVADRPDALAVRPHPPARAPAESMPLSRAQRRVWLASRRISADAFIISTLVRLSERIDAGALRAALSAVMTRQEMLRVRIRSTGTLAEQVVLHPRGVEPPLTVVELPAVDSGGPEVARALRKARTVSFELSQAPLFEICLLTGPIGGDLLVVTAHHVIYDGASVEVLLDDLFTAYRQARSGASPMLPPLAYSYADWVADEQSWLGGREAQAQAQFWRTRLAGAVEAPDLVDAGRRGVRRGRTGLVRRELPADVVTTSSATPFAIVVTAFTAMVHRATAATDLVVGFAASLRDGLAADAVVGYLANAVPLRLQLDPRMDLGGLLAHVRERTVEAYEHARLPFDLLAEKLRLPARPGRSVLLDLGVSWENATVRRGQYLIEDLLPDELPATSDLWLYASIRGDRLHIDLTYDDNLIHESEAAAFVDQVTQLVIDVTSHPQTPLGVQPTHRNPKQPWSETRYDF